MSVAERSRAAARAREAPARRRVSPFAAGVAALFAGALVLRLVGLRSGLPYVYNADENAHFVPRAIGMFGHSLNPQYFINPPGFTYVLHGVFGVRWGFDRAAVGDAFARDPSTAFTLARVASAVLGATAVALLAWAGTRLIDRRTGLVAAALLAVAFLPVHYSHLALNDVPALAPVCLALAGAAGVLRTGRLREYALAGAALGVGCAFKYTAGIALAPLLGAALLAPRHRVRGLALAGGAALAGFLVANPYALLDFATFRDGLRQQTETASGEGGKLGLAQTSGFAYYPATLAWGLGWLSAPAALAGLVGTCLRDRRLALVLVPAPVVFVLYMGTQTRFFARWMLPVYPMLCLLAAWAAVRAAAWLARRVRPRLARGAWPAAVAAALLCAPSLVFVVHNDVVLARADTRQLARDWLVAHVPAGAKVVVEPVFPDQWASDPGHPSPATRNGNRWIKWRTSRSQVANDGMLLRGPGRVVKLEDYERTTRPQLVDAYRRGGYCWVVTGSTQYGRAFADPAAVPNAIRYYAALRRASDVVYRVSPLAGGAPVRTFSFDFSFNAYPLDAVRAGPEIVIHRLRDCG